MVLALTIDNDASMPLYLRLSGALIEAIQSGQLQPGEALPSTRVLADTLSIAPVTAHRAYQDLLSRGYIETVAGRGTFVSQHLRTGGTTRSLEILAEEAKIGWSSFVQALVKDEQSLQIRPDLFAGIYQSLPTPDQLPIAQWRNMLLRNSRRVEETSTDYIGDAFGVIRLRKQIADYLRRTRGAQCSWEQIAIFSGSQHALDIVCRLVLDRGDAVAMEEPGYFGARRTFKANGALIAPVPIDGEGFSVNQLKNLATPPKLVYVTPSHQDPSGVVLSLKRRGELLSWAHQTGALILEDDNDCEYRHAGSPMPCLQGLDEADSVIYINTFWRTLGPLATMGYIVVPRRMLQVFTFVKAIVERDFPILEQCALADFLEEGYFERHIFKLGSLYKKRWHALTHAATRHLKGVMTLAKESAGMRVLTHFQPGISEEQILEAAYEAELPIFSTADYYVEHAQSGEFLIPFGHLDENAISSTVERFAQMLRTDNLT